MLSPLEPLRVTVKVLFWKVVESVTRTIGSLKSDGVTIVFFPLLMLGGGFRLLVLMRSLRAHPYVGGAQLVVAVEGESEAESSLCPNMNDESANTTKKS